jgi:hypothetical protein
MSMRACERFRRANLPTATIVTSFGDRSSRSTRSRSVERQNGMSIPFDSTWTGARPPNAWRSGRAATSLTAVQTTGQLRHLSSASDAAKIRDQFANTECTVTTTGKPEWTAVRSAGSAKGETNPVWMCTTSVSVLRASRRDLPILCVTGIS